jgi:hypothetical protein
VKKFLLISFLVAGCKQGLGDRCQVQADCESPLVCNTATQECAQTTGGGIDATVPDGPKPIDGLIDAPLDAAVPG